MRRTLCLVRRHLHWVLPMHCQSLLCCRALSRHAHENPKTQYMTFLDFQETSSSYWYGVVQCSAKLMICLILYILSSGFERMMMQGDCAGLPSKRSACAMVRHMRCPLMGFVFAESDLHAQTMPEPESCRLNA